MVKKFLISAAAVAALATSAMAYDIYPDNQGGNELLDMNISATQIIDSSKSKLTPIGFDQTKLGNALVFPAYFVGNGWYSKIKVINPTDHAIVAKVVIHDGKASKEVKDFNIYLSANDVWEGVIKTDVDGKNIIYSTDSSTGLINTDAMASEARPFNEDIKGSSNGYIEVIAMAEATTAGEYHHNHSALRTDYNVFVRTVRNPKADGSAVDPIDIAMKDGVIQNKVVTLPFVDINKLSSKFEHPKGSLTGNIRIVYAGGDSAGYRSMVMPAYKFDYDASSNTNVLAYFQGEKGNLADIFIAIKNGDADYDATALEKSINDISSLKTYLTYGSAEPQNNAALITNPFKRAYVQSVWYANDDVNFAYTNNFYSDVNVSNDAYGAFSVNAYVYNTDEDALTQFSPANTAEITIDREVGNTGVDTSPNAKTLSNYLKQAQEAGFTSGYVVLRNTKLNTKIPGIVTQMLGTKPNPNDNKYTTNWIVPQQQ